MSILIGWPRGRNSESIGLSVPDWIFRDQLYSTMFYNDHDVDMVMFKMQLLFAATTLLVLTACGPSASSTPDSTLSAEEVLKQARQAMDAVLSYRYTGEFTGEISIVDGEDIQKAHIEGEWSSSGASRRRISKDGTSDSTLEEIVSVGGQTLRRIADYEGGAWIRLEDPLSEALSRNLVSRN